MKSVLFRSLSKFVSKKVEKFNEEKNRMAAELEKARTEAREAERKALDTLVSRNQGGGLGRPYPSPSATGSFVGSRIPVRTSVGRFKFPDGTSYDVPVRYPFPEKMEAVIPTNVGEQQRYTFRLVTQSAYDGTMRGFYEMEDTEPTTEHFGVTENKKPQAPDMVEVQ